MTIGCKHLCDLSDEQLIAERNFWNAQLEILFYLDSGLYDAAAMLVRKLEDEMLSRERDGPP